MYCFTLMFFVSARWRKDEYFNMQNYYRLSREICYAVIFVVLFSKHSHKDSAPLLSSIQIVLSLNVDE